MARRQQGLAGGFYTGIVTIADGTLHGAKVIGDVDELLSSTDARNLPGSTGIIHSRSRGGGGQPWAQPFFDTSHTLAYMANGEVGSFGSRWRASEIAAQLLSAGCEFSSRRAGSVSQYEAELPNLSVVHGSEVMCHLVASNAVEGSTPAVALSDAFARFPSEIAGMLVHADWPGTLFAARINKPLLIGHGPDEAYVATSGIAFPEGDHAEVPIAPNTAVSVTVEGISVLPIAPEPAVVAPEVPAQAADAAVLTTLSSAKGRHFGAIKRSLALEWPEDALLVDDATVYESLGRLSDTGAIHSREIRVPGVVPDTTAPKTAFFRSRG